MARRTVREIERINNYEKKWKIRTNANKFQLISISSTKPKDIIINGTQIPFKNEAKMLGLTLTKSGLKNHVNARKHQATSQLQKLKRFRNLTPEVRLYLYKIMIKPILEYPAIPLCITSKANHLLLQRVQNKALRNIHPENTIDNRLSNETIHEDLNMEAINIRLYHLASKIWTKLEEINEQLTQNSIEQNQIRNRKDHTWWPRLAPYIMGREPNPILK